MSIDFAASREVSWTSAEEGSTAVLDVIGPTGDTSTPTVTTEAKLHTATVAITQPGQYQLRWTVDATDEAFTDVFNVRPERPRYLLSLADARKAALGNATNAAEDDFVQLLNASSTVVIEDVAGAILPKPTVQETDGGRPAINLWRRLPADDTEVTVTVNGTALTEEVDFIVDRHAMIVYAGSRTSPGYFPWGRLNVRIEYVAGRADVPPNIEQAAVELVRHQYQVGHQAVHAEWSTAPSGDDTLDATPSGYLIPRRVMQLCRPTPKLPSF